MNLLLYYNNNETKIIMKAKIKVKLAILPFIMTI